MAVGVHCDAGEFDCSLKVVHVAYDRTAAAIEEGEDSVSGSRDDQVLDGVDSRGSNWVLELVVAARRAPLLESEEVNCAVLGS